MRASPSPLFPCILSLLIATTIVWSGINPAFQAVWVAEIIPVAAIFLLLVISYPKFRFSNIAYGLMSVWLIMHAIGAHYTFANVPFDWFNGFFESGRNHFDRVAHYSIGFYAFPIAELLTRKRYCNSFLASFVGLTTIMAVAAGYEIIEWWYAVLEGGDAGIEFLGSQGDIWDAQKDMLADTLGAITSLSVFAITKPYKSSE